MAETSNQIVTGGLSANYVTRGGSPGSAGTDDIRVDRPNESLPGVSTAGNFNPASADGDSPLVQTRALMDSGKATFQHFGVVRATIDTTETSRLDRSADIRRMNPSVGL